MAFWSNKKKPAQGDQAQDEVRGAAAPDPRDGKAAAAAEKQRIKKIRAMKKKFDETVWEAALDVMRSSIPQFTMFEPDPEVPGGEIPRYVLLGFDTKTVDDFMNKSDDDVGSIMTAIKHSMDVVIKDALFDNELILVIPTTKSLAALAEFEETFDLRFFVVYATEEEQFSLETKTPDKDDDFIFITLQEIRDMLRDNVPIKEQIHRLQIRVGTDGDYGGLSGKETTETRAAGEPGDGGGGDDAMPLDDYEQTYGGRDEEEGPPPEDEPGGGEGEGPEDAPDGAQPVSGKDVAGAVGKAVEGAKGVGRRVSETQGEASEAAGSRGQDAPAEQPAQAPAPAAPAATGVQARIQRLRGAAQAASDQAKQDPEIQQRQQAMTAPQRPNMDMAALDQYIVRKYQSDDLGLEISSAPFDAMFLQSNPYVPFTEVESDGWLDGYVNNLRRDANAKMAKLHYENLLLMRTRFMSIVTDHCAAITKSVAADDPGTRFGNAKHVIELAKEQAVADIPAKAEEYKKQAEEAYQRRMQAEMENASSVAKANFINRYGKEHERELQMIETELRNVIEADFVAKIEKINDERRAEAKRQLDAGITEALKLCRDEYTKMIAQERQEYARLQALIVDYMNENMAADEGRVAVMAEAQRRDNEIVRAQEEAEAAMRKAQADYEARLAAIRGENEAAAAAHVTAMNELKDSHAHNVQEIRNAHAMELAHKDSEIMTLKQQLEQADARMDEMTSRFVNLDSEIEQKYRTRTDMLQSERDAWDERAHHLERLHKYTDKLKLTFVAVGFAASVAVGIIIGAVIMSGMAQDAVDRQAVDAAANNTPPEVHYFINGEEVDLDAPDGQESGQTPSE